MELIETADAEAALAAHLRAALASQAGFESVGVSVVLPTATGSYTPPGEVVTIRRTGGGRRSLVFDDAQLTVSSWGAEPEDEERASAIARRVDAVVLAAERVGFVHDVPCSSVTGLASPYPDPDPVTSRARFSATYVLALKGAVLPMPFNQLSP